MISITGTATFISVAASLAAIYLVVKIRSLLTAWNVQQAWNWMLAALLSLLMHSIVNVPQFNCSHAVISATAYFAATMLLTPLVTILGARRPGISAWHWFVVLPMVVVLQWPAISQLSGNHWRAPIELSAPSMMGIVVVLIMSAGTFLGTRSAIFAMLYSSGIVVLLTSVSSLTTAKTDITSLGPLLVLMALWMTRRNLIRNLHRIHSSENSSQRTRAVWSLFSSLHGFAWTRRVQDRINQFAPRERWTVQLSSAGFEHTAHDGVQPPTDDELTQPVEAFIWVLARFADEHWLRQILKNPQNPQIPHDSSNSPN
jgi:hypothetical protein